MSAELLSLPESLLLHVCCAPCSVGIMEALSEKPLKTRLLFYNPNIHPKSEYLRRKDEAKRAAEHFSLPFEDLDEDSKLWTSRARRFREERERGLRCQLCFQGRLLKTAGVARELGFKAFATTLSVSRHKDQTQVHASGTLASNSTGVSFLSINWRKGGLQERARTLSLSLNLYRQSYCGCVYSRERHKTSQGETENLKTNTP